MLAALVGCSVPGDAPIDSSPTRLTTPPAAEPAPQPPADPGIAAAPTPQQLAAPQPHRLERRTIGAGGMERSYVLSVPAGVERTTRMPLIYVFHGYKGDAEKVRTESGLDAANAVVVFMEGHDQAWAPAPYATTTGEQDIAFVEAVRQALDAEFTIDASRVFATGLSNGGGFASYLGCQRPQDLTAVGSVSAAFYERVSQGCSRIPIKHIDFHGTADSVIGYDGGQRHNSVYESSHEMLAEAAVRNHCDELPTESTYAPGIERFVWQDCDAPLEHYRIDGGVHEWPSFATEKQLEFFGIR